MKIFQICLKKIVNPHTGLKFTELLKETSEDFLNFYLVFWSYYS